MNSPYTTPEIKRYSNGDWCVEYWYQYPEGYEKHPEFKRFKVRDGINYIKDPELKEAGIQQLWFDIKAALEKFGYNPFQCDMAGKRKLEKIAAAEEKKHLTIDAAKVWFLEEKLKKNSAQRTLAGYESFIKNFILWISESNNEGNKILLIKDVSTEIIEKYLHAAAIKYSWKPRTFNNNLKGLITWFNLLHKKRKIPANPLENNAIEPITSRAERNKYYTKSLRKLIQPELDKNEYLALFIKWVYYTCARPIELIRLKITDIDLDLRKITVPAAVGKTGSHVGSRTIPLCEELYHIIIELGYDKFPRDYYIFSYELKPGLNRVYDDYFSRQYLKIKKKLKIDENYTIYSFKHTRVVDLLSAGYDVSLVMFLTGHTDLTSFQKYCRELGAVINERLKGKTISF